MAAMDFIHKQLVGAAGRDALSTMGMGAGMGAGLGAANALITGNDSLIGGATSGALLGAGGGAAMRYAGAKYGAGIAAQGSHANRFDHQIFSKAEKPFDFMGNSEANQASFNAAMKASPNAGAATGAPAAEAAEAVAGKVTTTPLPKGTNLVEHQKNKKGVQTAMNNADEYNNMKGSLGLAEAVNPSVARQAPQQYTNAPVGTQSGFNASQEASAFRQAAKASTAHANKTSQVNPAGSSNFGAPNVAAQERDAFRRATQSTNQAATNFTKPNGSSNLGAPNSEALARDAARRNSPAAIKSRMDSLAAENSKIEANARAAMGL